MAYRYGCSREARMRGESAAEERPSAKERIIRAAIDLYGLHGFDGVTIKQIAEAAETSAPLVVHHFGSKAGLRTACDEHVAQEFRRTKTQSVRQGSMPRNYAMEAVAANRHLVRYLTRAFIAGGPEIDRLFDQMIEDSLEYTAEGEAMGLICPSRDPRGRAVVMLLHSFGTLVLHRQLERHFGTSLIDDDPEALSRYMATVLELYTQPTMNREAYLELLHADEASRQDEQPHPPAPEPGSGPQDEGEDR